MKLYIILLLSHSLSHTSLSSKQIIKEKNNFVEFPEFVIKFSASEKIEYQVYLVLRLRTPPLCLCGSKTAPASPIKWFINPYYVNPRIFPFNLDIAPTRLYSKTNKNRICQEKVILFILHPISLESFKVLPDLIFENFKICILWLNFINLITFSTFLGLQNLMRHYVSNQCWARFL